MYLEKSRSRKKHNNLIEIGSKCIVLRISIVWKNFSEFLQSFQKQLSDMSTTVCMLIGIGYGFLIQ